MDVSRYKVKVLADSVSPGGVRLVTVAYQAPRVVLAELNTHRALSRNAESSRAIPFAKKLGLTMTAPYVPDDLPDGELLGESPGMQATGPIDPHDKATGQRLFRHAAHQAAKTAEEIADCGFHKQDVNRLLEPFGYTRGVISATDWDNFFALRCDWRAYPPFRFLARCIWVALSRSVPKPLNWGEWHLPFIDDADREKADRIDAETVTLGDRVKEDKNRILARWSAARCARVSMYEFGRKVRDWDKDASTYNKLAGSFPLHASPLEHPAVCMDPRSIGAEGYPTSNFRAPWVQMRKLIQGENIREFAPKPEEVAGWNVPECVFQGDPSTDW